MTAIFPALRTVFTALSLLAVVATAQAQWGWKGQDGRMVFSDQPPPPNIAAKDITRRPAGSKPAATSDASTAVPPAGAPIAAGTPAAAVAAASAAAAAAASAASAPKLNPKDSELEKRKKEADAKETANKKAEDEKIAVAKRDNCERAKRSKANMDSGARISSLNAKGEREVMNEAQRSEETKRLQGVMASDC